MAGAMSAGEHLRPLDFGWRIWRWMCVRGAGFPADLVLRLASAELAAAADRFALDEQALRTLRAQMVSSYSDRVDRAQGPERAALLRTLKGLRAGTPVDAADLAPLRQAEAQLADRRRELEALFVAEARRCRLELRATARDPRFREALLWQNSNLVRDGIDPFLREPEDEVGSKARLREQVVAGYLQRYSTKNDSIGFFGPIGWGAIEESGPPLAVRPGPQLLASRNVYLELWPMVQLAELWSQDPELLPHLRPRLHPTVYFDGATHLRGGKPLSLPPLFAATARACDGNRAAKEIAALLLSEEALGLGSEDEVYELLSELVENRLILWSLDVPATALSPERALRQVLESLGPPAAPWLQSLDELDQARQRLQQAAKPEQLGAAIEHLETTFARLSGQSATRHAGKTYGARTTFYEDCRRDLELHAGPALIGRLARPLSLVLASARWYTHTVGTRYHEGFREAFRACGSETVEYAEFARRAFDLFTFEARKSPPIVVEVAAELQRRWRILVGARPEERVVQRSSAELSAAVAEAFAAPRPGWPSARQLSPDILVAAEGIDTIIAGGGLLVLGELHVAINTMVVPLFLQQAPHAEALVRANEVDLAPRVANVLPVESLHRAVLVSPSGHDFDVETGTTRSPRQRSQVIAVSELAVREVEGALRVGTRDGRHQFDVIEFCDDYLSLASSTGFSLTPDEAHSPRVVIDDLVVSRESWRVPAAELAFATAKLPLDRFMQSRRWAAEKGMPRFVFVKSKEEVKPSFVDFESAVYVDALCKLARKSSVLRFSEMLPSPSETWLPDAEGRSYTCELRMVAVDPEPWKP
jgi:hypothetical protein